MSLRNVEFIGQSTASDNLENNIIYWLSHNLLNTCAYFNVRLSNSGSYGGEAARLRLSNDRSFTAGKVWEGFRKQWVWQSGVECATQPISISGVYVNNTFRPASGVGAYAFHIDYPNGRIIFDTAIATNSVVKLEHSFQYYQVYNSDTPWWSDLQRNSFRIDDTSYLISSSGFWAKSPAKRVQLPAVIVQATPVMDKTPLEIGSLNHFHKQDFRFYILTESNRDLKWIMDLITGQNEEYHASFDTNVLLSSGVYPIDIETGSVNSSKNYPELVNDYSWNRTWCFKKFRGRFADGIKGGSVEKPIFSAIIDANVETILN